MELVKGRNNCVSLFVPHWPSTLAMGLVTLQFPRKKCHGKQGTSTALGRIMFHVSCFMILSIMHNSLLFACSEKEMLQPVDIFQPFGMAQRSREAV